MSLFNTRSALESRAGLIPNPFENPAVPLSALGLDDFSIYTRPSDAGQPVSIDTSMAIPTVLRCVALLSTVVAGCPMVAYKIDQNSQTKTPIYPQIISPGNGNTTYTQYELWELTVAQLCLYGNVFIFKLRPPGIGDIPGPIIDLVPIDPRRVAVKMFEGNKIFEVTRLDKNGNMDATQPPLIFTTFEIMHIPGFGYDGLMGLSPIQACARTLGTAMAADKLAAKFYSKGTQLSGVVQVKAPLASQKQADQIRARWLKSSGGVDNAAEVAVLDSETTFMPLTIPPEQLQFLQARRWQTTEIARMFGIPPHLVGDVEKSTSWGTGIEQQNVGFVSYTISAYTNRISQRVSREIIPVSSQFAEFDLSQLLRGSQEERFRAYSHAITAGWLTRNEVRLVEHYEPVATLDEPILPLNMATLDEHTKALEAAAQPPDQGAPDAPATSTAGKSNGN